MTNFEGIGESPIWYNPHLLPGQVDLVCLEYQEDQEALEDPQVPDNLLDLE